MDENQIGQLIDKYHFKLEETHISWVLISNQYVYKIKKPVNFGFLDYSTLEKRAFFCQKEIELNSRLSKDIYIGVSTIVQTDNGIDIDKDGALLDYAVKMKIMPQDRMMDVLLQKNLVTANHLKLLAKIIAKFHQEAETDEQISLFGSIESNKFNTDENFEQTVDAKPQYLTEYQYNKIKEYTDNFYKNNKTLFESRIKNAKIRDCHGDMYSRNICMASDEKIYIYDCIEFNERFRYSDVASDIAFLLMDLEHYGHYDLSKIFLNYYIDYSQDNDMLGVLNFYKIYRAFVRGKIAYFQNNISEANGYFDLAFSYLPNKFKPTLIMMCGLTGSGKSYVADRLSEKIDAVVLNSDKTRKQLVNMNENQKDLSDFGKGIYTEKMTKLVYETMSKKALDYLRNGQAVILDATYLTSNLRNDVKEKSAALGIKPIIIYVEVNDNKVIEHFKRRENQNNPSDGRYEIYLKQKKLLELPNNVISINSSADIERLAETIENYS